MNDDQFPPSNDSKLEVRKGFHSGGKSSNFLYETIVETGCKKKTILRKPVGDQTSICQAILQYTESPKFKKLGLNTKRLLFSVYTNFFNFLSAKSYLTNEDIPASVLNEYLQWLRDAGKGSGAVFRHSNEIKRTLKYFTNSVDPLLHAETINLLHIYLGNLKRPKRPSYRAKLSMADLFDTGYTDNELITSLRLVSCWVLLEFQRQRQLLLAQPGIQKQLNEFKRLSIDEPPLSEGRISYDWKEYKKARSGKFSYTVDEMRKHTNLSKKPYANLFGTILLLDDSMLIERVALDLQHPFGESLSKSQYIEIIQGYIGKDRAVTGRNGAGRDTLVSSTRFTFNDKKRQYLLYALRALTDRHLITPSDVEIFAAQCFFSSERVQASNQARQSINDIEINERGLQAQHAKARAKKVFATGIYEPNSLIETAIRGYVELLKNAQPILSDDMKQQLFPYQVSSNQTGRIGGNNTASSQFFALLATQGTQANTKLINDISEGDAKPFIIWLQRLIEQNSQWRKENCVALQKERQHLKRHGKKPRRNISTSNVGLSIDIIGQSFNRASFQSTVAEKGTDTQERIDDEKTVSALQGHSLETKRHTYDDRAPKSQIDKNFAKRVAELMEEDAEKIGQYLEQTTVVDITEAKRLLGCESLQDDMQALLQEIDEEVGLSGELKLGSQTVFIANELTAALILMQIEHINSEVPLLLNDTPTHSKAINVIANRVYLEEVLKRFPKDIQRAGKKLSEALENIPFASLI